MGLSSIRPKRRGALVNLAELKEILQILEEQSITEFELEQDGVKLRVCRHTPAGNGMPSGLPAGAYPAVVPAIAPSPPAAAPAAVAAAGGPTAGAGAGPGANGGGGQSPDRRGAPP